MKKRAIGSILFIWMMSVLVIGLLAGRTAYASSREAPNSAPQNLRAIRNSNISIRLRWKADTNVDGYMIYRYKTSAKKYVKVKVIKDSSVNSWIDRKLRTNAVYKYKIASYKVVDGKKQTSALSDWVSAKTYKRYSKSINAQAPKVSTKKVYLGLRSSQKLKSRVIASKYGMNKKKKPLSTKVRWYSSNPSIADVDNNGVITAGIKPGNCSIYAKAHNGAKTEVKVIVKNYAKEDDFYNYGQEDDIYTLITYFKPQIQNIAEYYSIHRRKKGDSIYIELDDQANIVITPSDADMGNLREDIENLLVDFPYYVSIRVTCNSVDYILQEEEREDALKGHVTFWFDNDCSQWDGQIADHWEAYRNYPD